MSDDIITLDPRLLDDAFWAEAIERSTAFAPEARTEFRRGLIQSTVDDLAWARLVLHSITDAGLWPIVARLLELGIENADAEFIEPLVLFLTNPKVVERLQARLSDLSVERSQAALNHARQLLILMQNAGDIWAPKFAACLIALEASASSGAGS